MAAVFMLDVVAIMIVVHFIRLKGHDRQVGSLAAARSLRAAGLVAIGLGAAYLAITAITAVSAGDYSGIITLVSAAVLVVLGIVTWMRPREGGIVLLVMGGVALLFYLTLLAFSGPSPEMDEISVAVIPMALPRLVAGGLFLAAGLLARRKPLPETV